MWTSRVEGPSNVPTAHIGRYLSTLEGTSGTFQVCRHPLETHDSRHLPQHAKRQVQTCHFKRDGLVLGDINIYSYIYLEYIPILNIFMTVLKNLTHEDIGAAFKQKVM